jgi:sRNA-binding protein
MKARELNDRLNSFPVWLNYQPLIIGIDKDVFRLVNEEHFPGASKQVVRKVLTMHTHHRNYLQAIAQGGARHRLNGIEDGEITAQHQQAALGRLAK